MPELPDVEGFRRRLAEHAVGQRVRGVSAMRREFVRSTTPQGLGRALRGRGLGRPWRHGKWVLAPTDADPVLALHFGMTGELVVAEPGAQRHRHDRFVLRLDEVEVRVRDMRMLGGAWLARSARELPSVMGQQGPDAEGLDESALRERLGRSRGALKPALLRQERVAGVGNLLADEVLWRARLPPRRAASDLDDAAWGSLRAALADTLEAAVPAGRVPPRDDWLTGARDAADPRCPRCGTRLRKEPVGGRTTYWCPACQPE